VILRKAFEEAWFVFWSLALLSEKHSTPKKSLYGQNRSLVDVVFAYECKENMTSIIRHWNISEKPLYVLKSAVRCQISPGCSYKWDSENRLVSVTMPNINTKGITRTPAIEDTVVKFEYDGDGWRVRKQRFYGASLKDGTVYVLGIINNKDLLFRICRRHFGDPCSHPRF